MVFLLYSWYSEGTKTLLCFDEAVSCIRDENSITPFVSRSSIDSLLLTITN